MSAMHHHGGVAARTFTGRLKWSMAATVGLVTAEFIGGLAAHSIALITDAVHNLTDVPTLVISWLAARWAERPPTSEKTYGYHRVSVLAAFTNALLLLLVAFFLLAESYERLRHPQPVHAEWMLGLGVVALAVNGGITLALVRGRRDLNLRSVLVHNFGDALSNAGILLGAVVMRRTGIYWIDPLLGAAIGLLVLWSTVSILRESSHILLEGFPREMKLEDIARAILSVEPVQEVHDIHVWTLTTDLHILSCHVRIPDLGLDATERLRQRINERLASQFHIHHTTIQFEPVGLPAHSGLHMPAPYDSSA